MVDPIPLWTIGHSTTDIDPFLEILGDHDIATIADVRSHPGSRHSPQFGSAALATSLHQVGIAYAHLPALGGRRTAQEVDEAVNGGWRNRSFHNYADYATTDSFEEGMAALLALAVESRTAYLCAEALPWRCHRTIISDVLVARGHRIIHLIGPQEKPHVLGAWGPRPRCELGNVTYPSEAAELPLTPRA